MNRDFQSWLAVLVVIFSATIQDVASAQALNPQDFASIWEEKNNGSLRDGPVSGRLSIVDRRAIIHVKFDRQAMARALGSREALQERLDELPPRSDPAVVEQMFSEATSFEVSVVARVLPISGAQFDIDVEGYTRVRPRTSDPDSDSPQERSVVTSINRRPYRYEAGVSDDGEPTIVLRDDIQDAVIRLPSDLLEEGDRIAVTIVNHESQRPRSYTWKLEIKNLGVGRRTDPTLLLIKRETAPEGSEDVGADFKPSPGTSLVWTIRTRSRFVNKLDLRLGVNGSFVDFRADKNVELGVGPVVSLMGGMFQVTYGWNLHAKGLTYWAVGFGFLDISKRFGEGQ